MDLSSQHVGSTPTADLLAKIAALWRAIATEDPDAFAALVVPGKQLGLVWDLWGWPGVRLVTQWTPAMADREIVFDGVIGTDRSITVTWEPGTEPGPRHGASFWFAERPELRFLDATPSTLGALADEAYEAAMTRGQTPPWRAPAPDPVEAKLRSALVARKFPMDQQAAAITMWRRHAPYVDTSLARPEAWAAAAEGGYLQAQGTELTAPQMAQRFGANKGEVKRCFAALVEATKKL